MAYKFEDLDVWQRALDYADRRKDRGRQSADGGDASASCGTCRLKIARFRREENNGV